MKANLSVESLLVLPPGVSLDLDLDPGVVGVLCNLYYFLIYDIKILPRGMRRYVVEFTLCHNQLERLMIDHFDRRHVVNGGYYSLEHSVLGGLGGSHVAGHRPGGDLGGQSSRL